MTVLKPLSDLEVMEGGSGMFECEFSKPDLNVEWFKGDQVLARSYKFTPRNDGRTYRLMIKDAAIDDAGSISCAIDATKTTANLIVKGTSFCLNLFLTSYRIFPHKLLSLFTTEIQCTSKRISKNSLTF